MSWIGLIMDILYLGLVCNLNIAFKLHEVNLGVFVNLISLLNYCKNSFYKNKVEGEIVSLWPIMSCNYAFPLEHESRIYSVQDCNLRGLWFLWITMKDYSLCPLRVWHIIGMNMFYVVSGNLLVSHKRIVLITKSNLKKVRWWTYNQPQL